MTTAVMHGVRSKAVYMPLTAVEAQVVKDLVAQATSAPELKTLLTIAGFTDYLSGKGPLIGWIMGHLWALDRFMPAQHGDKFTPVEDNVICGLMLQTEADLAYMYSDTEVDEYDLPCFRVGYSSASYNALYKIRMIRYMHACGFSLEQAKRVADSTCSMVGYK